MYLSINRKDLESAGHLNAFELTPEGEMIINWEPSFLCGSQHLIDEKVLRTLDAELGKAETSFLVEKFADSLGRAAFMKLVS
jgi:hypothetical protein